MSENGEDPYTSTHSKFCSATLEKNMFCGLGTQNHFSDTAPGTTGADTGTAQVGPKTPVAEPSTFYNTPSLINSHLLINRTRAQSMFKPFTGHAFPIHTSRQSLVLAHRQCTHRWHCKPLRGNSSPLLPQAGLFSDAEIIVQETQELCQSSSC